MLDTLDKESGELFSSRSKSRIIGSALEEYKEARGEMRRLSLSGAAVKEKQLELERAKTARDSLNAEAMSLREQLTKLHRIAGSKADIARLQELRTGLAMLEWVPIIPEDARQQRDRAISDLTDANAQIDSLTNQIAQRMEKIKVLPVGEAYKAQSREIEALNGGTHDYSRSIQDLPKRRDERNKIIQRAEVEWRTVWPERTVNDAEQLRGVYVRKAEIYMLVTEQARLTLALERAEESLRSDRNEHDRLSRKLAASTEPQDPSALVASIEQGKKLGETDDAIGRLQSECMRIDAEINRDLKSLSLWAGTRGARISAYTDALNN